MNWLARLKNQDGLGSQPTEPTKPGFAGFVGTLSRHIQKFTSGAKSANDPAPDPDRWAWPHSGAMISAEIETFTARLVRFTDRGLDMQASERLADRLVIRDREHDDRRQCMECMHLHRAEGWRCRQWRRAGIGVAEVPAEMVEMLQRCDAFNLCGQLEERRP